MRLFSQIHVGDVIYNDIIIIIKVVSLMHVDDTVDYLWYYMQMSKQNKYKHGKGVKTQLL